MPDKRRPKVGVAGAVCGYRRCRPRIVHTKNAIVHTAVHRGVHTRSVRISSVFAAFSRF